MLRGRLAFTPWVQGFLQLRARNTARQRAGLECRDVVRPDDQLGAVA